MPLPLHQVIDQLQVERSDAGDLAHDLVERVFAGDAARLGSFVAALRDGLPDGTRIVIRGSAVTGESYETGRPFDADGPRSSDLDVVLIGDAAMAAWRPDAFAMPGVNTLPLYDEAPDIAPDLETARRAAQEIADRPVSLQAMARWFLDLRSAIQGTPYLILDG